MTKLLPIIIAAFLLGCSQSRQKKACINVTDTIQLSVPIKIYVLKNLDQKDLLTGKLDSIGRFSGTFALDKPTFAIIQIGNKYGELYLEPGYDLAIQVKDVNYTVPLQFSGEGEQINQYINDVNGVVEGTKFLNRKGIIDLNISEFRQRLDSIESLMNDRLTLIKDHEPSYFELLKSKNQVKLSAIVQEYSFYKLNRALNEKMSASTGSYDITKGLEADLINLGLGKASFDSLLFKLNSPDHSVLVNFAWQNQVNLPVIEKIQLPQYSVNAPSLAHELILNQKFTPMVEQELLAFDLQYRLASEGITVEVDSVLSKFRKRYPNSSYDSTLNKSYESWIAVGSGKSAPEFSGISLAGDSVSLSSLRGKLIYVDVWATWCAPCIAEIPYAKQLHEKFKGNHQLEFLNVSVDADQAAWKKFLTGDRSWKGLHINVNTKTYESLIKKYKLFGVPGYFLIDQEGKIVSVKAKRPSTGKEIEAELLRLLSAKI